MRRDLEEVTLAYFKVLGIVRNTTETLSNSIDIRTGYCSCIDLAPYSCLHVRSLYERHDKSDIYQFETPSTKRLRETLAVISLNVKLVL